MGEYEERRASSSRRASSTPSVVTHVEVEGNAIVNGVQKTTKRIKRSKMWDAFTKVKKHGVQIGGT
jgi:hypothetical protein